MPNGTIILTTKPSFRAIILGIWGSLFFGAFVYMMVSSEWAVAKGANDNTEITILWVLLCSFIFFTLSSLCAILTVKIIILTSESIIIKRPFILLKKTIYLDNIKQITESEFKLNTTSGSTTYTLYEGNKISVELFHGKSFSINSFEISDYYKFTNQLKKLKYSKYKSLCKGKSLNESYGYCLITIAILLLFGLIYSLFMQKQ